MEWLWTPRDLLKEISEYLVVEDCFSVLLTCKQWYEIVYPVYSKKKQQGKVKQASIIELLSGMASQLISQSINQSSILCLIDPHLNVDLLRASRLIFFLPSTAIIQQLHRQFLQRAAAFPAHIPAHPTFRIRIVMKNNGGGRLEIVRQLTDSRPVNAHDTYVGYKESHLTSGQGKLLPATPLQVKVEILKEHAFTV